MLETSLICIGTIISAHKSLGMTKQTLVLFRELYCILRKIRQWAFKALTFFKKKEHKLSNKEAVYRRILSRLLLTLMGTSFLTLLFMQFVRSYEIFNSKVFAAYFEIPAIALFTVLLLVASFFYLLHFLTKILIFPLNLMITLFDILESCSLSSQKTLKSFLERTVTLSTEKRSIAISRLGVGIVLLGTILSALNSFKI
ncbi:hypothetical protein [Kiloniella majae]|uniref:hypothetical protein n=1 Tax=Kiloniella majae TaxID=1938558 RepID=UPI000A278663|nr:hypothetical protein [Kiloniella majae]